MIGGGDWGEDRLIGDIVRAVAAGETVKLRNPDAVRPWQHVLNPLSGYLRLAQELWARRDAAGGGAGVELRAARRRRAHGALDRRAAGAAVGGRVQWELDGSENPPEAGYLALDSGKAERSLGWRAEWDLGAGAGADRGVARGRAPGRGHAGDEPRADRAVRRRVSRAGSSRVAFARQNAGTKPHEF